MVDVHSSCKNRLVKLFILTLVITGFCIVAEAQNRGQKLFAPDAGVGDNFGCSVALSGDYALIGAKGAYNDANGDNDAGVAFIFKRDGKNWIFHQKISEPEIDTYDDFGFAVDLSADYAVIGAPQTYAGGSAFVYKRNGDQWEKQLILPEYSRSDFGTSVSIDGSTLVVGAPDANGLGPSSSKQGAAWVFQKSNHGETETWVEVDMLAAGDGLRRGHLGHAVDIAGNKIIAGAWTASADYFGRSAAYIFENDHGNWVERQRLFPQGLDTTTNHFGKSVSISGNIAAVGAPENMNNEAASGAVYIFELHDTIWSEIAKLISPEPDTSIHQNFGRSVDLQDQRIVVGAYNAAYIYERNDQIWNLVDSIHHNYFNSGYAYHNFGESLAMSDTIVIAGTLDDCDMDTDAGAAHIFTVRHTVPTDAHTVKLPGSLIVYPNPVKSKARISHVYGAKYIYIHNSIGAVIRKIEISENSSYMKQIDFAPFESGIYWVRVLDKDQNFRTAKVVKL